MCIKERDRVTSVAVHLVRNALVVAVVVVLARFVGNGKLSFWCCLFTEYPTAEYIEKWVLSRRCYISIALLTCSVTFRHLNAYTDPAYSSWSDAGYAFPKSSLVSTRAFLVVGRCRQTINSISSDAEGRMLVSDFFHCSSLLYGTFLA